MTEGNATPKRLFTKCCCECNGVFQSVVRSAEFCSTACRKTYNNRRAVRGAEIYDIAMAWRFGDGEGRINEARDLLCALLSGYNEEDKKSRPGRRSYGKYSVIKAGLNRLPAVPDGR